MSANHDNPGSNPHDAHRGAGERLRVAREAAGLTRADVAARLKMPLRVVQSLEDEDWSRLGAPVFVRGQLASYSKLLGIATAPVVEAAGVARVVPPTLTPRTFTSPLQRFAEQAARRVVYIVMTVAIAIPVWLATQTHLDVVAQDAAPLDLPAQPAGRQQAGQQPARSLATRGDEGPRAVVASLASLPQREPTPVLTLQFHGDSWIEVRDGNGSVLEQSLVHAGDRRSYEDGEVGSVVLGNAAATDVRNQGRDADLGPYLRANVARFTVSSDGSLAPAAD
jgi:cytoskeleton protein RodZ